MRFDVEHRFPAPPAAMIEVFCDPDFHARLDLPDLSRPDVVESSVDGNTRVLRLRYAYVGQLDGIAKTIVGDRPLTWIQELRLDTATFTGSLTYSADGDAGRLNGEATVTITALDDGSCSRHIAGDLRVRIPVVGGRAEKAIVPGLIRRIDVEAAALAGALTARS
jgi:hypothetical protein